MFLFCCSMANTIAYVDKEIGNKGEMVFVDCCLKGLSHLLISIEGMFSLLGSLEPGGSQRLDRVPLTDGCGWIFIRKATQKQQPLHGVHPGSRLIIEAIIGIILTNQKTLAG